MSKFKVGDRVLTPNGEKGKITKINENYVDVEYLLNGVVIKQTFYTHALSFQKTLHQELLDLGWEVKIDRDEIIFKYMSDFISYNKEYKKYDFSKAVEYGVRDIELQLILDYIKELKEK